MSKRVHYKELPELERMRILESVVAERIARARGNVVSFVAAKVLKEAAPRFGLAVPDTMDYTFFHFDLMDVRVFTVNGSMWKYIGRRRSGHVKVYRVFFARVER